MLTVKATASNFFSHRFGHGNDYFLSGAIVAAKLETVINVFGLMIGEGSEECQGQGKYPFTVRNLLVVMVCAQMLIFE